MKNIVLLVACIGITIVATPTQVMAVFPGPGPAIRGYYISVEVGVSGLGEDYEEIVMALYDSADSSGDFVALGVGMAAGNSYDLSFGVGTGVSSIDSAGEGMISANFGEPNSTYLGYYINGLGSANGRITTHEGSSFDYDNGYFGFGEIVADWAINLEDFEGLEQILFHGSQNAIWGEPMVLPLYWGDFNFDSSVDIVDLAILAGNYNNGGVPHWGGGDSNGD